MKFEETIQAMQSVDYKDRLKAEYWQLEHRANKLYAMLVKWENGELDFEPPCPRDLYQKQLVAMTDYERILKERIDLEGIDLYT